VGDSLLLWTMVYRSIFPKLKKMSILVLINDHDPKSKSYELFRMANLSMSPYTARLGRMFCRPRSYLKQLSNNLPHLQQSIECLFIDPPANNYGKQCRSALFAPEAIENSQARCSTRPGAFRHRSWILTSVPHQPEGERISHRKPHHSRA
jgi:hypothetical protein